MTVLQSSSLPVLANQHRTFFVHSAILWPRKARCVDRDGIRAPFFFRCAFRIMPFVSPAVGIAQARWWSFEQKLWTMLTCGQRVRDLVVKFSILWLDMVTAPLACVDNEEVCCRRVRDVRKP
jgi:hypothetical protein